MIRSVLIIDDDVSLHRLIKEELKEYPGTEDVNVFFATTGEAGLEKYIKYRSELILLDLKLPDINGYETAKRLLHIDPDVNIILLTSYVSDPNVVKSIEYGVRGFISKNGAYVTSVVGLILAILKIMK